MKAVKLATMILMLFAFTIGCTDAKTRSKASIERGMTKQQVTTILGRPDNTSFDQYGEEWEYYKTGLYPFYKNRRIVVGFDTNGVVITYHSSYLGSEGHDHPVIAEASATTVPVQIPLYQQDGVYCINDHDLSIICNNIKKASFKGDKYALIEVASLGCYYNCNQCVTIMNLFDFNDEKMKALKYMATRIIDPQNANIICKLFDFSDDKDKAMRLVQGR